jgi:hypothetical protein
MYEELILRFFSLYAFRAYYTEKVIQDFFDKIMKQQCENPNNEVIEDAVDKFNEICTYLQPMGCDIFKLARLNLSTSMFDAIFLSLATTTKEYRGIDTNVFKERVNNLRINEGFKKYAGAASSNATAINRKLVVARKILLEDDAQ